MKVQYPQLKQIFGLLPEELKKDKELRADFIGDFTDGKTTSTKELSQKQAQNLIGLLKGRYARYGAFDKTSSQHLAVLNLCYDLGWTVFNEKKKRNLADLERLGAFINSKKSPVKKPLIEMSSEQCSKLIYVLESILKTKYNQKTIET